MLLLVSKQLVRKTRKDYNCLVSWLFRNEHAQRPGFYLGLLDHAFLCVIKDVHSVGEWYLRSSGSGFQHCGLEAPVHSLQTLPKPNPRVETLQGTDLHSLGRPDLKAVLTKLHVFRLTQFSKIIFLDADVLPIRPLSHLFALTHEFSAVPDVGWPDIFNSGVMVLSPGEDKFNQVNDLFKSKGSWDGGDQGILNEWRAGDWNRLSFTYNTTPTAAYT